MAPAHGSTAELTRKCWIKLVDLHINEHGVNSFQKAQKKFLYKK